MKEWASNHVTVAGSVIAALYIGFALLIGKLLSPTAAGFYLAVTVTGAVCYEIGGRKRH